MVSNTSTDGAQSNVIRIRELVPETFWIYIYNLDSYMVRCHCKLISLFYDAMFKYRKAKHYLNIRYNNNEQQLFIMVRMVLHSTIVIEINERTSITRNVLRQCMTCSLWKISIGIVTKGKRR